MFSVCVMFMGTCEYKVTFGKTIRLDCFLHGRVSES